MSCDHEWDPPTATCVRCSLTAEAVALGRDKPATWDDVDAAYAQGLQLGGALGRAQARRQRRRFMALGMYVLQRRLRASHQR